MIDLLNIDCMEYMKGLEDNAFELAITSPPYNLNKKASGGGSSKRGYEGWYPDDKDEALYQAEQKLVVSSLLRVCKSSVFYNHRIRYAWHSRNKYRTPSNIYHPFSWLSGFPIWSEIIWHRGGTTGHANGRCRLADERIYQIGKPTKFNDMGYTTVWKIPPSKNIGHVCTFPEELVEKCILMCTNEGDTVFDPYSGSGTVAVVCDRLGRNFVGCELDEDYYKASVKRFDSETSQMAMAL
jgi:DNA modification methylase